MKRPWQIKVVDFKVIANIAKDYDGSGLYNPETRIIYIDKSLPKKNRGSMRGTLEHELVHAKLDIAGIKLDDKKEEMLADLINAAATPAKYQSSEERLLKKLVCCDWSWARGEDNRKAIVRKACRMAKVRVSSKLLKALV